MLLNAWWFSLAAAMGAQSLLRPANVDHEAEILVLKNGNVLRGKIERTSQHYSVATPQNNRLIVPLSDADFIASTIDEAYWGRLSRLPATDLDAHRALFFWCLKYQLFDAASNQLEILQTIGLRLAEIQSLSRRLDNTRNQLQTDPPNSNSEKLTETKSTSANPSDFQLRPNYHPPVHAKEQRISANLPKTKSDPFDFIENSELNMTPLPEIGNRIDSLAVAGEFKPLNSSDTQPKPIVTLPESKRLPKPVIQSGESFENKVIAQVAFEENEDDATSDKSHSLSAPELEAFVKSLPAGSFQAFRQRVERQLVFNCGDCHRQQSTEVTSMPLLFKGKYQPLSGRMSQRNIHAVLQLINLKDPENSPVLKASISAHGTTTHPPFNETSNEYRNLQQWVLLMAQEWKPQINLNEQAVDDYLDANQSQTSERVDTQTGSNRIARSLSVDAANSSAANHHKTENRSIGPQTSVSRGSLTTPPGKMPELKDRSLEFRPKDEFDPEIFNRFHRLKSEP